MRCEVDEGSDGEVRFVDRLGALCFTDAPGSPDSPSSSAGPGVEVEGGDITTGTHVLITTTPGHKTVCGSLF